MNKPDVIKALTELEIPHDEETRADDLKDLLVAVKNAVTKSNEEAVAREIESQNEVKKLNDDLAESQEQVAEIEGSYKKALAELEAAKNSTSLEVVAEPGAFDEATAELIAAKMAAGLPREQAEAVAMAQIDHDTSQAEDTGGTPALPEANNSETEGEEG